MKNYQKAVNQCVTIVNMYKRCDKIEYIKSPLYFNFMLVNL